MGASVGSIINEVNCFCNIEKRGTEELFKVSKELKLSILPIDKKYELEDLYPLGNHVSQWNVFIIGKNKNYVLSSIGDEKCLMSQLKIKSRELVDTTGSKVLPPEIFKLFNEMWELTLSGKQLQYYIVANTQLYLVNTYVSKNNNNKIIGASLFMRAFEQIPITMINGNSEELFSI